MAKPLIALLGLAAFTATQPTLAQQPYGQAKPPAPKQKKAAPPSYALLPAVPGRTIRDVPNIAIKYYDVSGKDFAAILKAIEQQRRNAATGQVMPGGAGYGLGGSVNKEYVKDKCTVVEARVNFTPTAELPRLVNEAALKPDQLALWRGYLSQIEVPAAAGLWFIHDRIPALKQSALGKECEEGVKLLTDGLAKLRADHSAYQQTYAASLAPAAPAK